MRRSVLTRDVRVLISLRYRVFFHVCVCVSVVHLATTLQFSFLTSCTQSQSSGISCSCCAGVPALVMLCRPFASFLFSTPAVTCLLYLFADDSATEPDSASWDFPGLGPGANLETMSLDIVGGTSRTFSALGHNLQHLRMTLRQVFECRAGAEDVSNP